MMRVSGRGRSLNRVRLLGLAAALGACGAQPREPVRSVAGPPLVAESARGDAGPVAANESPTPTPGATAEAPEPAAPSATPAAPAALPATLRLSRGTGTPLDAALKEGDIAYEADDFTQAEASYRKAALLATKDPAPWVGLARVTIAKTNVPTDYN